MQHPLFYLEQIPAEGTDTRLPDDTARHILTVLRMRTGEILALTDGKGTIAETVISETGKKNCSVVIRKTDYLDRSVARVTIAVSLLKNHSRFEWLLEKVTELGVARIVPLICARTERQHFRVDRMKNILISAMLQSRQRWIPEMPDPQTFPLFLEHVTEEKKFIAHCLPDAAKVGLRADPQVSQLILIGPEGDFDENEINAAVEKGFIPVTLGNTRLRSETAAVVSAGLMMIQ